MQRLTSSHPNALPQFREGLVSAILEHSTDSKGILRPEKLLNMVSTPRMQPEALDTLLGKDVADGLRDFATNYSKAKVRVQVGTQLTGMAATGAMAGSISAGAAVGAGLETANELGMLGGMLARSPSVMNKLKLAVLGRDEKALMGILLTARLVGGQVAGATLRQLLGRQTEEDY
jgi:hypothetical protein